jgi:1,4-alpha-glucan branching enzyme
MHHTSRLTQSGTGHRYSAKKMKKPINFFCQAPDAKAVMVAGDFNEWSHEANPMRQGPDGAWHLQVPLHHGHHRYVFVVDGRFVLDPKAQGVARNDQNERVSLMSVS